MKRINLVLLLSVLLLVFFFYCGEKSDLLEPPATLDTGTADFSTFVAVGNSLTAGVQSGALYKEDSKYSFPKLVAGQVETEFVQPEMEYPGFGGYDSTTSTILGVYEMPYLGGSPAPATVQGLPPDALFSNKTAPVFHNLGIPGILTADVIITTTSPGVSGSPNPLIDFVLRGSGNTPLQQAIAQSPTFMTLWIGNNDVLGAVIRGDVIPTLLPTPKAKFQEYFTFIVKALDGAGIDFVVMNIPGVASIPFVTTLPPVVFDPVTLEVILDENGAPFPWTGISDWTNAYVLLSSSAALAASTPVSLGGQGVPLADNLWLSGEEIAAINQAVNDYNDVIDDLASQYGFAVVDVNHTLTQAANEGLTISGEYLTTDFITGGLFSLDGIHPSSKGYGIIANKIIAKVNSEYGASISLINLIDLPTVRVPLTKSGRPMTYYDVYRESDIFESVKRFFPGGSK